MTRIDENRRETSSDPRQHPFPLVEGMKCQILSGAARAGVEPTLITNQVTVSPLPAPVSISPLSSVIWRALVDQFPLDELMGLAADKDPGFDKTRFLEALKTVAGS